jgi:filamentous hemagglutinin
MDAGTTFAQQYQLRPGVSLSAQQMAALTSDIVWLVEQTVTLPDGSSTQALVPQVYARMKAGDLDGAGTLLAGQVTNLNLSGDISNTGTVQAAPSSTSPQRTSTTWVDASAPATPASPPVTT